MYSLIISFIVANCVLTVFNKDNDDDDDDETRLARQNSSKGLHSQLPLPAWG